MPSKREKQRERVRSLANRGVTGLEADLIFDKMTGRSPGNERSATPVSETSPATESRDDSLAATVPQSRNASPAINDTRRSDPLPPARNATQSSHVSVSGDRAKGGYLRVPNAIADELFASLTPDEAIVYFRLYRLSYGFGQETCMVGAPALARATNLSERSIMRIIKRLESRSLVERTGANFTAPHAARGNTYRVNLPPGIPASLTGIDRESGNDSVATNDRGARNKVLKEKSNSGLHKVSEPELTPAQIAGFARAAMHEYRMHHPESTPEQARLHLRAWAEEAGYDADLAEAAAG
jgi:hypothetical protein